VSDVVLIRCHDGGAVPTATSALEVVDGEVRELIRRRGLDPFTDPGPVRLLVRDVVADYSERSLTSALPPIGDPESVVRDVLDRVAGGSVRCSGGWTTRTSTKCGSRSDSYGASRLVPPRPCSCLSDGTGTSCPAAVKVSYPTGRLLL
jgi:hypothetical protein